jgi:hypothetical protein
MNTIQKTVCPVVAVLRRRCGMRIVEPDAKVESKSRMYENNLAQLQRDPKPTLGERIAASYWPYPDRHWR